MAGVLALAALGVSEARADAGFAYKGFGGNFGNFANGASGAQGAVDAKDATSVTNDSTTYAIGTLGRDCLCGGTIAAETSGAHNSVSVTGGTSEIQSNTVATSQAGVGYGSMGVSGKAGR
jgi:hypothetical protein